VVNKLDTVGWSQERFQEVVEKLGTFLKQAGFRESDVTFVPCSGLTGENLVSPPSEDMLLQWYKGPCLLDVVGMSLTVILYSLEPIVLCNTISY
jgi:elongation factor 1 alpha-like protein